MTTRDERGRDTVYRCFDGAELDGAPLPWLAPVGSFPANRLGLRDLAGNVREWASDWYAPDYYVKSPDEKVAGPESGEMRVIRGGSWASAPGELRISARRSLAPSERSLTVGFRCATDE